MTIKQKDGIIYCIHGNSSSSRIFDSLKNDKTIKQKVIANDLPGHGKNQYGFEEANFTIESYRKLLLEEINSLDDNILLVGNSLGGHLAIEIANDIKNLKGLVIMGAPPVKQPINFDEAWISIPALNTFFTKNPTENEIQSAFSVAVHNFHKIPDLVDDFTMTNPEVRMIIANDIMQNKLKDEYKLFTTAKFPKYIISGKQDPTVNRKYLQECINNSENCKIIDIDDCGHYPIDCEDEFKEIIKKISKTVF